MPDRPRRHRSTLRFIPRPRRTSNTATKSTPSSSSDTLDKPNNSLHSYNSRTRSFQPQAVSQTSLPERHCDSLPAEWSNPTRLRRAGRRVSPAFTELFAFWDDVSEKDCDAFDEIQLASSTASMTEEQSIEHDQEQSSKQHETEVSKQLLAQIEELRRQNEQNMMAIASSLAAQNAHVVQLEARVAALQSRKASRIEVLIRTLLDYLTTMLIALFAWGIAQPVGRVWEIMRGKPEQRTLRKMVRRSWRLSEDEQTITLDAAAKRVGLAVVGE